jgi:predicted transcriptional regulator of viral defense system
LAVQISRWHKAGRLLKLKRGVYVLSRAFCKVEPPGLYLACLLNKPAYVSEEKALEYYGLIPEAVYIYSCVTTKRQGTMRTPLGNFDYRHVKASLFWGYRSLKINGFSVYIATPEKALLDLFYLRPVKVTADYVDEMRLQNLGSISIKRLREFARRFGKPKLIKAAEVVAAYIQKERRGSYER